MSSADIKLGIAGISPVVGLTLSALSVIRESMQIIALGLSIAVSALALYSWVKKGGNK